MINKDIEGTIELTTKPVNRTYIPVSRVASAKLGSGWFTRTTRERENVLGLEDLFHLMQILKLVYGSLGQPFTLTCNFCHVYNSDYFD